MQERPKTYLSVSCWLCCTRALLVGHVLRRGSYLAACVVLCCSYGVALMQRKFFLELDISCTVQEPELTTHDGKVFIELN